MKGELIDLRDSVCLFVARSPGSGDSVLLFVPGLGDGFFALPFFETLCSELESIKISFSHIIMRSSYNRYGQCLMEDDCKDIEKASAYLKDAGFCNIFLMGHSTGCQDILYYMKHTIPDPSPIKGIILLGSVSDRESPIRPDNIIDYMTMDEPLFIVPGFKTLFKKERLFSLFVKGGSEDMFSSDLDSFPYFENLRVKTLILLSRDDECIPKGVDKDLLLDRWKQSNPALITGDILPGKHFIDEETFIRFHWPMIFSFIYSKNICKTH